MQPQNTPGGDIKLTIGKPRPINTDILSGLIAAVLAQGQNTNNQSLSQSSFGPQGQTGINQQGVDNAGQPNAYQKGVQSALKKLGEQHVAEANASGVDPMSIASHPVTTGMANFGGNDPQKIIAQLLSTGKANGTSPQQPNPQMIQQPQNASVQNIQPVQQKQNWPQVPPGGLLSRLTGMDLQPEVTGQRLDNMQKAQKIQGNEPLQQSDYQKAALETQQKIDQAIRVPPSQENVLTNQSAVYGHQVTALNDMYQKSLDEIQKSNEEIKNLGEYRSWVGKPFGSMPASVKAKFRDNALLHAQAATISDRLYNVASNPPKFKPSKNSDPALIAEARRRGLIK